MKRFVKNIFLLPSLLLAGWLGVIAPAVHGQGLLQKAAELQRSAPAAGAREGLVRVGEVQAGLVAEQRGVIAGKTAWLGLRMIHDPHWHTYWRNPGDSGLATTIEWTLPQGWKAGEIQWPTPKRIAVGPLANFGFEGDLLLPVAIQVPANAPAGKEVLIKAKASWLVCKDVCIPGEAELAIRVPVIAANAASVESVDAPLFAKTRALIPPLDASRNARAYLQDKTLVITWPARDGAESGGFFYPHQEGLIAPAQAQRLSKTSEGYRLDIALGESASAALNEVRNAKRVDGVWLPSHASVGMEWRASLASGAPMAASSLVSAGKSAAQEAPAPASAAKSSDGLWAALGAALLGGMILNLMPCVFPVIGLKTLSFAQSAHSRGGVMVQSLVFSAGVILSFLALAGLLIGLRAAGESIGWGFQLQSPWVVLLLALLFVLIAVNLFGVFEMGLLGARAANFSFVDRAASASGAIGSFASGVLAVVVASPCTAPFMGSAIGFTAAAGTLETLAVFAALGVGMSLPYVVLAASPGLMSLLPKPGPWMVRFKQVMAFPMLAAAAWLFWVLANLQGPQVLLAALCAAVSLAAALWVYGTYIQTRQARIGSLIFLLAMIVSTVWLATIAARPQSGPQPMFSVTTTSSSASDASAANAALAWQPWTSGLPEQLQSQGQTVFVDFTATWCITCQANKIRVLDTDTVKSAFAQAGVKTLRADWTRRDALIAAELARHGRSGVPLYLVYPGKGGAPKVLSEWLTENEVLEAIR